MTHICVGKIQSLVQIMACRLFGAKPSSEPVLTYCHLDHRGHNDNKQIKINNQITCSIGLHIRENE